MELLKRFQVAYIGTSNDLIILKLAYCFFTSTVLFIFLNELYAQFGVSPVLDFVFFLTSTLFIASFLWATTLMAELTSRYRTRVKEIIKSESGLVLIDSLVGTVILSIALLALIYTSTTATRTTTTSTERTQAMYIAQATLEGFKRFDGQPAINTTIDNPMVTVGNVNYRVGVNDVTVTDLNTYRDTTTYNLRTLQVTVGWPFAEVAGTEPHQIAMTGYFYAHP